MSTHLVAGRQPSLPVSSAAREPSQGGTVGIRPIVARDLGALMKSVGPLVDSLYPHGAAKLLDRLEGALSGRAVAHVASIGESRPPIALAVEVPKGRSGLKLGTFWVAPLHRGRRIGTALLDDRVSAWRRAGVPRVHVTVRANRAQELERLFLPKGFTRELTVVDRYGESRDEVVLAWRADRALAASTAA